MLVTTKMNHRRAAYMVSLLRAFPKVKFANESPVRNAADFEQSNSHVPV